MKIRGEIRMREQVIERIEKEKLIAIVQRRFDGEEIGDDPDEEI